MNICSSYSGTSAVRHFVMRIEYRHSHSDTFIGTALRRACGASCIRLAGSGPVCECTSKGRHPSGAVQSTLRLLPELEAQAPQIEETKPADVRELPPWAPPKLSVADGIRIVIEVEETITTLATQLCLTPQNFFFPVRGVA